MNSYLKNKILEYSGNYQILKRENLLEKIYDVTKFLDKTYDSHKGYGILKTINLRL